MSRSAVEPPTVDQLRAVAARHHLTVSDDDLTQYKAQMDKILRSVYEEIDKLPDQCLPVKYKGSAGVVPQRAENPYNAWVCITNTVGAPAGKLMGKTIALKDNIALAGVPTTICCTFMDGFTADYNATVVDRILDEGAIVKGKAACEAMCFTGTSFTSVGGHVLNPHDTTRSAGGSSSGSAALVAAGDVDMAIGTDQGGSIRLPASWCGIVGLKPTHGLVPYTGIIPLEASMDFVGPMTKTVKDCALLLQVIAGWDGGLDPRQPTNVATKNYVEALTGSVKGLRVGLLKEGFEGCEPDVAQLVTTVAKKLIPLGATVEEFSTPLYNEANAAALVLVTEGAYHTYHNGGISPLNGKGFKDVAAHNFLFEAAKTKADRLPIGVKMCLLCNGYIHENHGAKFYAKAMNGMRFIVTKYNELFKNYDVIIMPTIKYKAPKLPTAELTVKEFLEEYMRNLSNTIAYDATGHPAISVNAGFFEGLPVGLQIVGNHWQDDVILNVAYAVEQIVTS